MRHASVRVPLGVARNAGMSGQAMPLNFPRLRRKAVAIRMAFLRISRRGKIRLRGDVMEHIGIGERTNRRRYETRENRLANPGGRGRKTCAIIVGIRNALKRLEIKSKIFFKGALPTGFASAKLVERWLEGCESWLSF